MKRCVPAGDHTCAIYAYWSIATAFGHVVAADTGIYIIPASGRQMCADVHYRFVAEERAASRVILSHRLADRSRHIDLIKQLIAEMDGEDLA